MAEDPVFIANVKALALNGTLSELLRRIEADAIEDWKIGATAEARENAHATLRAIEALRTKIISLAKNEEVWRFNNRRLVMEAQAKAGLRGNDG